MKFRNLTLFRFPVSAATAFSKLERELDGLRLQPCSPVQLTSWGAVSPFGDNSDQLVHRIGEFAMFTLGWEDRVLPTAVVHRTLAERIGAVHAKEGRRVGAKERKRLREEVISELLPRAFCKPGRVNAYVDTRNGWLVIDTASRRLAENVVGLVREALGSFPATPLAPEESPRACMTQWLTTDKPPHGYVFGQECDLRDPAEAGARWNGRCIDLESDEVREHLKAGAQVFRMGLVYRERVSFVLGEDLRLHKFRLLDLALDALGDGELESARAELDAMFAILTAEVANVLDSLATLFGIERPGERE